jgi:hypothetical protein
MNARSPLLFLAAALLLPARLFAQAPAPHPVYNDTVVATIRIAIDPDSLARLMDPANADSDHEYPATFTFDNGRLQDTLRNIGFRLRGNTSRDARKKSFKVSVNTFERGRKYQGLEKLNLNGEHNDPSMVRAKLSWDLFADLGAPAPRAAHARLFINGLYYGLTINVEHVDENFAEERFGNGDGNLYKCLWPADLTWRGSDPNLYKFTSDNRRAYELTTNEELDDYTDLANFIGVLTQTPSADFPLAIQRVFDVNSYLRVLAVDIASGSWDDYWFLKNNYYLYHNTATGKFHFIPYDYDNTFGIWWTGIMAGVDWGTRPVYTWGHPTEPRPLATRLLAVPAFRDRLSFYLDRLLQRHYTAARLFPRIDALHALITPAAEADSFRTLDYGYTVQQFHNSYEQPLGAHVTYGLKPFVTTRRASAVSQLILTNVPPILSGLVHAPKSPFAGDRVTVLVRVEDEALPAAVQLHHAVNGVTQNPLPMADDGLHGDGRAGDEVFGAILGGFPAGATVEYHVSATDAQNQVALEPPDAPATRVRFRVSGAQPRLFVNELMAKNDSTVRDPAGDLEDWIEIFNGDSVAVNLRTCYLTDNFNNPTKWRFPDTTLGPGRFLLVWADEEPAEGPLHAMFKLDRDGERVGLYRGDSGNVAAVDTVTFGYQPSDVSYGRATDGGSGWMFLPRATPGFSNRPTSVADAAPGIPDAFTLLPPYPNPFNPAVTVQWSLPEESHVRLTVVDLIGREIATLREGTMAAGSHTARWEPRGMASGVYYLRGVATSARGGRTVRIVPVVLAK